jgi:hypothetical protein
MTTAERSPEYYLNRNKTNDKFVILYGEPFMKVQPVPSLLTSKTLKAAVDRGDWLVVNMNTGDLTVYSKARQLRDKLDNVNTPTPAPVKTYYTVTLASGNTLTLSSVVYDAIAQLNQLVTTQPLLNCVVTAHLAMNRKRTVRYLIGESYVDFAASVRKLYATTP